MFCMSEIQTKLMLPDKQMLSSNGLGSGGGSRRAIIYDCSSVSTKSGKCRLTAIGKEPVRQWKHVRRAARRLRRSLEMNRERKKRSAWRRVSLKSFTLLQSYNTAVKVTVRALCADVQDAFTNSTVQLTFSNWSLCMPLYSPFRRPNFKGARLGFSSQKTQHGHS